MRGKVAKKVYKKKSTRITPAYAGKRSSRCSAMHRRRDHPRLCGEKFDMMKTTGKVKGSPPPMRGKEQSGTIALTKDRITPAYAGKRDATLTSLTFFRDHPRLCGEKGDPFRLSQAVSGSPPPMRGKVKLKIYEGKNVRITPAYAGKRQNHIVGFHLQKDHPRLCGEKSTASPCTVIMWGSPPPMRGKVYAAVSMPDTVGITPAYAGKRT